MHWQYDLDRLLTKPTVLLQEREIAREEKLARDRERRKAEREASAEDQAERRAARAAQQLNYEVRCLLSYKPEKLHLMHDSCLQARSDRKRKKNVEDVGMEREELPAHRASRMRHNSYDVGEGQPLSPGGRPRSSRQTNQRNWGGERSEPKRDLPPENIYQNFEQLPDAGSAAAELRQRASLNGLEVTEDSALYIRHAMHLYINRILDTINHGCRKEERESKVLTMEDIEKATVDLELLLPPYHIMKLRELCFVHC